MNTYMLAVTMGDGERGFFTEAGQPVEWFGNDEGKRAVEETIAELVAGEGNLGDLFDVYGANWEVKAIEILEVSRIEVREYEEKKLKEDSRKGLDLDKMQVVLSAVADLTEDFEEGISSVTVTSDAWLIVIGKDGKVLKVSHPNHRDLM